MKSLWLSLPLLIALQNISHADGTTYLIDAQLESLISTYTGSIIGTFSYNPTRYSDGSVGEFGLKNVDVYIDDAAYRDRFTNANASDYNISFFDKSQSKIFFVTEDDSTIRFSDGKSHSIGGIIGIGSYDGNSQFVGVDLIPSGDGVSDILADQATSGFVRPIGDSRLNVTVTTKTIFSLPDASDAVLFEIPNKNKDENVESANDLRTSLSVTGNHVENLFAQLCTVPLDIVNGVKPALRGLAISQAINDLPAGKIKDIASALNNAATFVGASSTLLATELANFGAAIAAKANNNNQVEAQLGAEGPSPQIANKLTQNVVSPSDTEETKLDPLFQDKFGPSGELLDKAYQSWVDGIQAGSDAYAALRALERAIQQNNVPGIASDKDLLQSLIDDQRLDLLTAKGYLAQAALIPDLSGALNTMPLSSLDLIKDYLRAHGFDQSTIIELQSLGLSMKDIEALKAKLLSTSYTAGVEGGTLLDILNAAIDSSNFGGIVLPDYGRVSAVPLPGSLPLSIIGLGGLLVFSVLRKKLILNQKHGNDVFPLRGILTPSADHPRPSYSAG